MIDVSVIIPVYNAAETINGLVNKLLQETRLSIELIIVNDGSTDETGVKVQDIRDSRVILIEQENQGVYAARNAALNIHRGEWVIFLDADDDVADGFIYRRWQVARRTQADVAIFNAWRTDDGVTKTAVHTQQPYEQCLSGHDWVRHCVSHREWPHYLWLQMVRSAYIREHSLCFQQGRSHKDILWTVHLALSNGRFCLSDIRDYTYRHNAASVTHRCDYFDIRAMSYIDVIAEILRLAGRGENKEVKRSLSRHALAEARHFLGLYRNSVQDKSGIRACFGENVSLFRLLRGVSSVSDLFFFIKLAGKLL